MKRSEMEEKIQQHLLENGGTQAVDIPGLLKFLVEQGMQPPAYEKKTQIRVMPYNDVWTSKKPVNEWEPEDDQH